MVSGKSLWDLMGDLSTRCYEQEDSIRLNLKLSPAEYRALRALAPTEGISCQDFARRLRLSFSRSSRVIDRMVERGFLVRSDCDADRRCKSLTLTPQGLHLHQRIRASIQELETKLLKKYSRSRITALKKELSGLAASFPQA
jgi:DNA-binding MarR family transcriptional regulator